MGRGGNIKQTFSQKKTSEFFFVVMSGGWNYYNFLCGNNRYEMIELNDCAAQFYCLYVLYEKEIYGMIWRGTNTRKIDAQTIVRFSRVAGQWIEICCAFVAYRLEKTTRECFSFVWPIFEEGRRRSNTG